MERRRFLTGALAAGAALTASPSRLFAQAAPDLRTRRLLDIARREVERAGTQLWRRDLVGIADFGLHSSMPRFHFVDLEAGRADSVLVTHGSGSDPEHDGWLNGYSNLPNSWATSRGAYITWEWYTGRYGTSVRLGGLDPTNSNAFPRAIVMHAASYSTPAHVARWGRLGRSNGCFAFGPEIFPQALTRLMGGRLLFADSLGIGPDGEDVVAPPQKTPDFEAIAASNG
ncbi:murein L,D-transpeptidase catalytic domain-containing protein [Aurantiacibacter poecillastricola]|uniref:murein L,D-transpeptidase catalytic domain-containing protein n=1 Tax=Aurantiacibacter poecillastricola TaxID=3064385 RepID=UPI00273F6E58|nr:murein L,D-transpeptidase catalytic domain family protein [Aurantiacibacter sp. 219JJ12-13]MDP5261077.1 murein L,D-transpeptidase catalytic domain family protein [Aurantiacibacter sp. 219JJ12-13]